MINSKILRDLIWQISPDLSFTLTNDDDEEPWGYTKITIKSKYLDQIIQIKWNNKLLLIYVHIFLDFQLLNENIT